MEQERDAHQDDLNPWFTRLARYFAGDLGADERDQVERWIGSDSRRPAIVSRIRRIWTEPVPSAEPDVEAALASVMDRLGLDAQNSKRRTPSISARKAPSFARQYRNVAVGRGTRRAAASALGALLVLLAVVGTQKIREQRASSSTAKPAHEFTTVAGQRARVSLPDGTNVILGPESHLSYTASFSSTTDRIVTLDGQALFTVTHSAGTPFIVRAGAGTARVLGTSFAVRRYASDTAVQVVVAQGRVAVDGTVLNTGDIAVATASDVDVSRGNVVGPQLAWADGRLVFIRVPFRDVVPELERWYGITIDVIDPILLNRSVVTTLGPETAPEAMQAIAISVGAQVSFKGSRARFSLPKR